MGQDGRVAFRDEKVKRKSRLSRAGFFLQHMGGELLP